MQWRLLPGWDELRNYQLNHPVELRDSYGRLVWTPFESWMIGGTPSNHALLYQRGNKIEDMHIPISILGDGKSPEQNASIEEVNFLRERVEFNVFTSQSLGFYEDPELRKEKLAVSLEPIDAITGATIKDPRILGIWDESSKTIKNVEGRSLNQEYYQGLKTWAEQHPNDPTSLWRYVRDGKSYLETASPRPPEKR